MGARKSKKKAEQKPAEPALPAPVSPLIVPALATAALLVAAAFDTGPLGFLPPVMRWPLVAAALGALWLSRLAPKLAVPAWAPKVGEGLALAAIFASFLLLKLVGLHATDTDDNIYYYMAQRMAQGAVPYRDFFFAHPPVHLLVPALVFKLFGFSLGLAKAIPLTAQLVAGVCLFLALRPASRSFALIALLLHLTTYEVLMGATDMDGENLMTAFLAASVLLAVRRRPLAAGILSGLALGTGLYALAGVVALLVAYAGTSRRSLAFYAAGLAGCVALWIGVFAGLGGSSFWDGVFRYHLAKAPQGGHIPLFGSANPFSIIAAYLHDFGEFLATRTLAKSVFWHSALYVSAALGIGLAVGPALAQPAGSDPVRAGWRKLLAAPLSGTPQGLALLGGLAGILFLFQWAALNEVYDFYLVPMLVLMSLPAAWAWSQIAARVAQARVPAALGVPAALVVAFCLHVPIAHAIHDSIWPEELRDRGQIATYTWRDPSVLAGPAQLTRALFFRDRRTKGEPNPPYLHYLWNKSLAFSKAGEIAEYVKASSAPDETITGASTLAPLVALLADRRIAADEADTNNKRFRSGLLSDRDFWGRVCADRLKFVLTAARSHFTEELMDKDPTARRFFVRDRAFDDPLLRHFRPEHFVLYRRRDDVAAPGGRACEFVEEAGR